MSSCRAAGGRATPAAVVYFRFEYPYEGLDGQCIWAVELAMAFLTTSRHLMGDRSVSNLSGLTVSLWCVSQFLLLIRLQNKPYLASVGICKHNFAIQNICIKHSIAFHQNSPYRHRMTATPTTTTMRKKKPYGETLAWGIDLPSVNHRLIPI